MSIKNNTIPLHQTIFKSLRHDILTGKFPVDSRLPSMEALAEEWQTSVFTIWRAVRPLAREGLLDARGRSGMVILSSKPKLKCAGVYYGANIWNMQGSLFYRILHREIEAQLNQLGVSVNMLVDQRTLEEQTTPQENLLKVVEERKIQGLIIPITNPHEMKWLESIPIPKVVFGTPDVPWKVSRDNAVETMMMLAHLKKQGVRKVGMISGSPAYSHSKTSPSPIFKGFQNMVSQLEMQTTPAWCISPQELLPPEKLEEFGYQSILNLWNQEYPEGRPEGLISTSETVGKGLLLGLLKLKIDVPNDLKIMQFKNKHVGFFTPLPFNWIVWNEAEIATALIESLLKQVRGESVTETLYVGELVSQSSSLTSLS